MKFKISNPSEDGTITITTDTDGIMCVYVAELSLELIQGLAKLTTSGKAGKTLALGILASIQESIEKGESISRVLSDEELKKKMKEWS